MHLPEHMDLDGDFIVHGESVKSEKWLHWFSGRFGNAPEEFLEVVYVAVVAGFSV